VLASSATLTQVSILAAKPHDDVTSLTVAGALQQALTRCARIVDLTLTSGALVRDAAPILFPPTIRLRRPDVRVSWISFPGMEWEVWSSSFVDDIRRATLAAAERLVTAAPASLRK